MAAAAVDKFPWPAVVFRCEKVINEVQRWLGSPKGREQVPIPDGWTAAVVRSSPAKIAARIDDIDGYAEALNAAGYGTAVPEPSHAYEGKSWIDANELRAKLVTAIERGDPTKFKARSMAVLCGDRGDWVPGRLLKSHAGKSALRVRVSEYASRIDPPREDTEILLTMQQSALSRFRSMEEASTAPAGAPAAIVGASRLFFLYRVQTAEVRQHCAPATVVTGTCSQPLKAAVVDPPVIPVCVPSPLGFLAAWKVPGRHSDARDVRLSQP